MVDITVLGEVCLDTLYTATPYSRLGGVVYSALAGRCVGASTAIIGYLGQEGEAWVRAMLTSRGVDHSHLRQKGRPTLQFSLHHVDEVEPSSADRVDSGLPNDAPPFPIAATRVLLLYSFTPDLMHQAIDACQGATICYDLQYDMYSPVELERVLRRCQIVLVSRTQAMSYFQTETVADLASTLLALGPTTVVVKSGLCGSTIYSAGMVIEVPRFESDWEQSVGAGDVYNAVFLATWLQTNDLYQAGLCASAAAARFCEGDGHSLLQEWDLVDDLCRPKFYLHPDKLAKCQVYLAAPFFNMSEEYWVDRTKRMLEFHGVRVYSPKDMDGRVNLRDQILSRQTYLNDISAMENSSALVALLDSGDPGTMFEVGFAIKKGIPVIGLWTGGQFDLNLMLAQGTRVVRDYRDLITAFLEEVQLRV